MKFASTVAVPFVGKSESNASKEEFDDAPLLRFATRKRKVRADDSNDLAPIPF